MDADNMDHIRDVKVAKDRPHSWIIQEMEPMIKDGAKQTEREKKRGKHQSLTSNIPHKNCKDEMFDSKQTSNTFSAPVFVTDIPVIGLWSV